MDNPTTTSEDSSDGGAANPRPGVGDAESGNTASHNCKTGEQGKSLFEVVWQGIDTLELTYQGKINESADSELSRLKTLAQSLDPRDQVQAQYCVGERPFEVADKSGGRFFAYLLRHPDMRVAVASKKAKRIPLATVTLQNYFLVSVGPEAAEAEARALVESLGIIEGSELVKRCDLAADVATDQDIGAWPASAWVTRAERLDPHYVHGRFTGWSIGLGADVSGRLYDKKLEIVKSNKAYFLELWKQGGWFPFDPVVRIEHQLRRQALAQFGLRTLKEVLEARPALWSYATREWTKLAIPSPSDETKARWPLHPFWEQVQAIKWDGSVKTLERKRPSTNAPSDKVLARMFKAVATAVMARDDLGTLQAAGERLTSLLMAHLQRVEEWEGASSLDMLMEAVMLKRRKYCIPVKP